MIQRLVQVDAMESAAVGGLGAAGRDGRRQGQRRSSPEDRRRRSDGGDGASQPGTAASRWPGFRLADDGGGGGEGAGALEKDFSSRCGLTICETARWTRMARSFSRRLCFEPLSRVAATSSTARSTRSCRCSSAKSRITSGPEKVGLEEQLIFRLRGSEAGEREVRKDPSQGLALVGLGYGFGSGFGSLTGAAPCGLGGWIFLQLAGAGVA